MNNDFYLINLKQHQLVQVRGQLLYGIQQVNMGIFCSVVRLKKSSLDLPEEPRQGEELYVSETKKSQKINQQLINAQRCI
eukprot:CAMPEP_0170490288 /NCGR_PEP_ID=MMETSP0208-20121228/8511_1 /TAXON_ID=197538 /ORGANISM="Strombidium inclinatum, Strain S3" /LENGTH=79 /DNA_ID=CAMNT_0010765601 /DNA_START=51 /DNA_END=290 /DNA_ORIENTATION=+